MSQHGPDNGSFPFSGAYGATYKSLLILVVVTSVVAIGTYIAIAPKSCSQVEDCAQALDATSTTLNAYAACALSGVIAHEVVALVLNWRSSSQVTHLIHSVREVFIPSILLCVTFGLLLLENVLIWSGFGGTILMHATFLHGDGQPIATVIYLEWLFNVPILLTLAGKCALGLRFDHILGPIVVTNVYIILAWAAYFVLDARIRWTLVAVSFAMYGWASWEMAKWAFEFLQTAPDDEPTRFLKPCLAVSLIVLFGIYAVMYLCELAGSITFLHARVFYASMNVAAKLAMSMAFAGIRAGAYHEMLINLIVNTNLPFRRQIAQGSELRIIANDEGGQVEAALINARVP